MAAVCKRSCLKLPNSAMNMASSSMAGRSKMFLSSKYTVSEERRARRKQAEEELNRKDVKSNKTQRISMMEAAIKARVSSAMANASTVGAKRKKAEEELNQIEDKRTKIQSVDEDKCKSKLFERFLLPDQIDSAGSTLKEGFLIPGVGKCHGDNHLDNDSSINDEDDWIPFLSTIEDWDVYVENFFSNIPDLESFFSNIPDCDCDGEEIARQGLII